MDTYFNTTKEKCHECLSSFNADDQLCDACAYDYKFEIMQKPLDELEPLEWFSDIR